MCIYYICIYFVYKHTYPGSPSELLLEWVFHRDYEGGYSIYYIHTHI